MPSTTSGNANRWGQTARSFIMRTGLQVRRKIRQQRRMTQEKLAFEAEIDLIYVGGIGRGKRNSSLLVMARIAAALSVPLAKPISD
jgi:transcriptional regulator with XRE-family HTH domain